MTQWTNKYVIMRDLSLAQGCAPVVVEGTLRGQEKPPALKLNEETEEYFLKHGAADGNIVQPDLGLIRSMLDMVRGPNPTETSPSSLEIQKPEAGDNEKSIKNKTQKTRRTFKNVAMASFLEDSIGDVYQSPKQDIFVLKKPEDFAITEKTTKKQDPHPEAFKKVTDLLEKKSITTSENQSKITQKKKDLILAKPFSMFKRKSPPKNPSPVIPATSETTNTSNNSSKIETYKPSQHAEEYCRMYNERTKMQVLINEDIWARAERRMKEIDFTRKLELLKIEALSSQKSEETPPREPFETSNNKKLDVVRLTQHRHLMTGDCIVCQVLCGTKSISK